MRCKSCDSIMEEYEIIWYEERQQHEDLCVKCRNIVREYEYEQGTDILYPDDTLDDIIPIHKGITDE